jgi:type IV secretory pathway TraG/TraD family ATPase VirD4
MSNQNSGLLPITGTVVLVALLISIGISLCAWLWIVISTFGMPGPLTLLRWMSQAFTRDLIWVTVQALLIGFGPVGAFLYFAGDWGGSGNGERILRGARLVTAQALATRTRIKGKEAAQQVQLAGVPVPLACEPSHFLFAGSTNTGKSVAIDELLSSALARGDRCIVIDPNGHALARFAKKGDQVLNPFDRRSPGWSLFNEVRKPYDYERLASSVIPESQDSSAQQWHSYARQLLAETMRALSQTGETTTEQLLHWLTQASAKELSEFLAGSAASGLFEPGAEKALASTRFILSHYVGVYQHLRPGDFSLRDWLETGKGNLYVTWREDMLTTLKPLVSGWVDILIAAILTLSDEQPRPLWLVLDELASLEHLSSLEAGLTKGRKHGLRVVAGLQSVAQLDAIYGLHAATTLRSCFRNLLALGCSSADPSTAQVIADGLGQVEVERTQTSHNNTRGQGVSTTRTTQRAIEPLVLPSQLTGLAPLYGFLKLAGDYPVADIRLKPGEYLVRHPAFVER